MQPQTEVGKCASISDNNALNSSAICSQESECAAETTRGRIGGMNARCTIAAMLSFVFLILGALLMSSTILWADPVATPHTTIVVNGAGKLAPGEWNAFAAALRSNLRSAKDAVSGMDDDPVILPDSDVIVGLEVDDPLVVFLHGDCAPRLDSGARFEGGRLGWVNDTQGSIEPFIHIECDNIVRMLAPVFLHLRREARINAMGEAMARTTLHEWVHIKRQQPGHDNSGIEKAYYSLRDLIPDFCIPVPAKPQACFPAEYGGSM